VIRFQNLADDPALDWMGRGVPEMLVTDLAQAPGLEVLDPGRGQRFESQAGVQEGVGDPDRLRHFAGLASVAVVVRGSYLRLGERLRLVYRVEATADGELLLADQVEGRGDESLFGLVDQVSAAIRLHFELPIADGPDPGSDPAGVEAITTTSLEAWRLYTEGLALHRGSKTREALPMLERAIELDPEFALAHAELGKMRLFLGHADAAAEHTRRALELGAHLPLDQRFYLEANDAATRWSSYPLAIERFGEALEIYPEREAWRAYRAYLLASVDRYGEAKQEYDRLIAAGTSYAPTYLASANVSAALGNEGAGWRLLADRAAEAPDDWFLALGLGWHLTTWGRFDDASRSFDRAETLRPGDPLVLSARFRTAILARDWPVAEDCVARLLALDDPSARWRGRIHSAHLDLLRGRAMEALSTFESTVELESSSGPNRALACAHVADLLLWLDRPAEAAPWTDCVRTEGRDHWPEVLGSFQAALAAARGGRPGEAETLVKELAARLAERPNRPEERQLLHLRGLLALGRGEVAAARQHLDGARALLSPRGVEIHEDRLPDHVATWWSLAQAHLADAEGAPADPETAERWLRRIVESGSEHATAIAPFVLAHHRLADLLESQGRTEEGERWRRLYPRLDGGLDGGLDQGP
jgi:tetratricopeptide (TPR) repeat protein